MFCVFLIFFPERQQSPLFQICLSSQIMYISDRPRSTHNLIIWLANMISKQEFFFCKKSWLDIQRMLWLLQNFNRKGPIVLVVGTNIPQHKKNTQNKKTGLCTFDG